MSPRHAPQAVTFRTAWRDGAAILTVGGDIDLSTVWLLRRRLTGLLRDRPGRLIIDLARVRYIDAAGARALARAASAFPPSSPLVLRSPSPIACRVFQLTGLDRLCVVEAAPAAGVPAAPDEELRHPGHPARHLRRAC